MKKSVAIVFGGQSSEHEVSLQSARNVINAIDRERYTLTLIGVDKLGRWLRFDEADYLLNANDPARIKLSASGKQLSLLPGSTGGQFVEVETGKPLAAIDVVFPLIHGAFGEDGALQGVLRMLAVPFVGADVLASAACMDKDVTKRLLRDAGIAVAPFMVLSRGKPCRSPMQPRNWACRCSSSRPIKARRWASAKCLTRLASWLRWHWVSSLTTSC